jgi:hypothetical protein
MQQSLSTKKGKNEVNLNLNCLANSVYYITIVRNNENLISKKIIISDN